MTQQQITHVQALPACSKGHTARHIHDRRGASAGGGHFIECMCKATRKHPDVDLAMKEWVRLIGKRGPYKKRQPAVAADDLASTSNVVQLGLRIGGGLRNG